MIQIQWNGITFGGPEFTISALAGWFELPGADFEDAPGVGHGRAVTAGTQGARIVVAGGRLAGWGVPSPTVQQVGARDGLVARLRRAMVPRASTDADLDDLIVTAASETGTARAQLVRYALNLDTATWESGSVPWSAQWRCPDPRIFGAEVSASVPLLVTSVGAKLPRLMSFVMPAKPIGGRLSISNPGNDPEGSPAVYELRGAQSGSVGLRNVTTGVTVTYNLSLGVDDVLSIDTERGGAYLNGAYRPSAAYSGITAGLRLAPGLNIIQALGSAGAGSPSLTVRAQPASW